MTMVRTSAHGLRPRGHDEQDVGLSGSGVHSLLVAIRGVNVSPAASQGLGGPCQRQYRDDAVSLLVVT